MNKFNLTEEPWIPCLMLKDNETKDLSLFEVLSKAHEIKEITDNSPLVVVSLHRLLLAILHRNFGPASFSEWKKLWNQKKWDAEIINRYFDNEAIKSRFNLFDAEKPFYQVAEIKNKRVTFLIQLLFQYWLRNYQMEAIPLCLIIILRKILRLSLSLKPLNI